METRPTLAAHSHSTDFHSRTRSVQIERGAQWAQLIDRSLLSASLWRTSLIRTMVALIAGTAIAAGCSDETTAAGPARDATFAIVHQVDTPDGRSNLVSLLPDLTMGQIDPSAGLEVAGSAGFLFPPTPQGYFIVANSEDLTVTRYDVSLDGQFTQGRRFSLAGTGETAATGLYGFVWVDNTKAYHVSNQTGQIVVFNPTDMVITGTIDLPPSVVPGFEGFPVALMVPRIVGERLYVPVTWLDWDQGTSRGASGVAIIDTNTDSVVGYDEDERCDFATDVVDGGDGYLYFGTNGYPSYVASMRAEPVGCVVRLRIGTTEFDPDYLFTYRDAGLPDVAHVLAPSPTTGNAFVTFLDESILEWSVESTAEYYSNSWRVYEVNLPTRSVVREAEEFGLSLNWLPTMVVDGDIHIAIGQGSGVFDQEYTLTRLEEGGARTAGVTAPGEIWQAARLHETRASRTARRRMVGRAASSRAASKGSYAGVDGPRPGVPNSRGREARRIDNSPRS